MLHRATLSAAAAAAEAGTKAMGGSVLNLIG